MLRRDAIGVATESDRVDRSRSCCNRMAIAWWSVQLLQSIERARRGGARVLRRAEERRRDPIPRKRTIAVAAAFVEACTLQICTPQHGWRTVVTLGARQLELLQRAGIFPPRLHEASIAVPRHRVFRVELERLFERLARAVQIVLFQFPPAFERQAIGVTLLRIWSAPHP